jgi:hypothetical protein
MTHVQITLRKQSECANFRTNIYMCTCQFLDDLETKLCPAREKERKILLQLKKEELAERGLPFDDEFYIWDYR